MGCGRTMARGIRMTVHDHGLVVADLTIELLKLEELKDKKNIDSHHGQSPL